MTGTLIATIKKADVHGLAYKGIMAWTRFPQLRDILARKFGDEYVLFFARPVENDLTNEIDWYTPVQGEAKSVAKLPESEKEAACAKVRHMAADVQAYAEELAASPDPLKATRGQILKLALLYPDDDYIFVSGEQPIIVCWGFGPGTPGVEPRNLTRLAPLKPAAPEPEPVTAAAPAATPAPAAAPAPPPPPVSRPFSWAWLWWLLPVLAALLLLLVLCTSFGGNPPLAGIKLLDGPRLPFLEDSPDHAAELARLEHEVAGLHAEVMKHAAMCKPAPAVAEKRAALEPGATSRPELAIEEKGAPEPEGASRPELVIPEKADDTSFLAGQWLCRTGLANARTREPVEFAFEFGADGKGRATVFEKDDRCGGDAIAQLQNGELRITVGPQKCGKSGAVYSPLSIICRGSGANTHCSGTHEGGGSWDANFEKTH